VKYVLFYESADDVASKAPAYFPAHRERLDEFHARGRVERDPRRSLMYERSVEP